MSIELAAICYIQVSGTPTPDNRRPVQRLSTSTQLTHDEEDELQQQMDVI